MNTNKHSSKSSDTDLHGIDTDFFRPMMCTRHSPMLQIYLCAGAGVSSTADLVGLRKSSLLAENS